MTLRARLALWFGALAGLVVVLACLYGYAVHGRTHYEQLDLTLRQTGGHVFEEFAAAPTPAARREVLHMADRLGTTVQLYGSAATLAPPPHAPAVLPPPDAPALLRRGGSTAWPPLARLAPSFAGHATADPLGVLSLLTDRRGARWRALVLPLADGTGGLIVAAPLDHLDASVAAFGRVMAVLAVLGAVLTFGAGWLVAGRALRPVATLTDTASAIAVSRAFTRRVPDTGTPDELGRLARTFNDMLGSLEQAMTAQQRFVADASHELRAPLAVIQANLELLRRPAPMAEADQAAALTLASQETDRLRRLVADLLALARADAGLPLTRVPVALDEVVAGVLADARHLLRGQQLVVGTLEEAVVDGDADRLRQLCLILLDNAIQYTPAQGRITVDLLRTGDGVRLRVRDTGIGIAAADLPHIFDRFFRADPARSRAAGGTGLGLPIARWIARQHGGDIAVESTPGQGTTVTVALVAAVAGTAGAEAS